MGGRSAGTRGHHSHYLMEWIQILTVVDGRRACDTQQATASNGDPKIRRNDETGRIPDFPRLWSSRGRTHDSTHRPWRRASSSCAAAATQPRTGLRVCRLGLAAQTHRLLRQPRRSAAQGRSPNTCPLSVRPPTRTTRGGPVPEQALQGRTPPIPPRQWAGGPIQATTPAVPGRTRSTPRTAVELHAAPRAGTTRPSPEPARPERVRPCAPAVTRETAGPADAAPRHHAAGVRARPWRAPVDGPSGPKAPHAAPAHSTSWAWSRPRPGSLPRDPARRHRFPAPRPASQAMHSSRRAENRWSHCDNSAAAPPARRTRGMASSATCRARSRSPECSGNSVRCLRRLRYSPVHDPEAAVRLSGFPPDPPARRAGPRPALTRRANPGESSCPTS